MKRSFQIFLSIIVSFVFIYGLYSNINWHGLGQVLAAGDFKLLVASLLIILPITILLGIRFWLLVPYEGHISLFQSIRLLFIASTFNLILPAKLGDMTKVLFIRRSSKINGPLLASVVTVEKGMDLFGILLFVSLGLFWLPHSSMTILAVQVLSLFGVVMTLILFIRKSVAKSVMRSIVWSSPKKGRRYLLQMWKVWTHMHRYFSGRPSLILVSFSISILESALTFVQIWLFFPALHAHPPFLASLSLIAIAMLATMFPFTVAGIGPRDAVLVLLFLTYCSPEVGTAVAMMATVRLILPALIGAPLIFTESWMNRRLGNQIKSPN